MWAVSHWSVTESIPSFRLDGEQARLAFLATSFANVDECKSKENDISVELGHNTSTRTHRVNLFLPKSFHSWWLLFC